jgi:hypothetical protein
MEIAFQSIAKIYLYPTRLDGLKKIKALALHFLQLVGLLRGRAQWAPRRGGIMKYIGIDVKIPSGNHLKKSVFPAQQSQEVP